MNPQSALQQQYPLSPKKFWKKVIEKLLALYILGIVAAIIDFIVIFMVRDAQTSGTNLVLWGALILGILFIALVTFLYGWYIKVYIKRYYYAGEEHFITIKKGVFAPAEIHVQWQKIQDVYVDQDILDRIMGLYDVHIASATATSGIEAHIDGVEQVSADGLKQFLLDKVSGAGRNNIQNNTQNNNQNDTSQPLNQTQQSQTQSSRINLSEEISSKVYPLSGKWFNVSLIGRLIGALFFSAFIVFIFIGKITELPIADNLVYLILGWLVLVIVTMVIQTISLFLWKKNYAFDFTPDNIYYREGVISLSEKHMPYSSIQDVTVKQGVIERFFSLAKVVIENAAQQAAVVNRYGQKMPSTSGIVIQGLSIADANKITNILKTTVLGRNNSQYGL